MAGSAPLPGSQPRLDDVPVGSSFVPVLRARVDAGELETRGLSTTMQNLQLRVQNVEEWVQNVEDHLQSLQARVSSERNQMQAQLGDVLFRVQAEQAQFGDKMYQLCAQQQEDMAKVLGTPKDSKAGNSPRIGPRERQRQRRNEGSASRSNLAADSTADVADAYPPRVEDLSKLCGADLGTVEQGSFQNGGASEDSDGTSTPLMLHEDSGRGSMTVICEDEEEEDSAGSQSNSPLAFGGGTRAKAVAGASDRPMSLLSSLTRTPKGSERSTPGPLETAMRQDQAMVMAPCPVPMMASATLMPSMPRALPAPSPNNSPAARDKSPAGAASPSQPQVSPPAVARGVEVPAQASQFRGLDDSFQELLEMPAAPAVPQAAVTRPPGTPLHPAAARGGELMDALLRDLGFTDVNAKGNLGKTALHCATESGRVEAARALLDNELFLEANAKGGSHGRTALHVAVEQGDADAVRMLMGHQRFTAVDAGDDVAGRTALHYTAEGGHAEIARMLLSHGRFSAADVRDSSGASALHVAAMFGRTACVRVLLDHARFSVGSAQDRDGRTALHYAGEEGHAEAVRLLLGHPRFDGCDVKDADGWTALHCASAEGHAESVKALLDHRRFSAATMQDASGWTALHCCAAEGHADAAKVLATHPRFAAAVGAQDRDGNFALDLADQEGHDEVVEVLQAFFG